MIWYYGHNHLLLLLIVVSICYCSSQLQQPPDDSDIINKSANCPTAEGSMTWSRLESWSSNLRDSVISSKVSSTGCGKEEDDEENPLPERKKKILLIGVDGIRADAAGMLPLPNFRRLERMGTYTYWATVQKLGTAVSGPGWVR